MLLLNVKHDTGTAKNFKKIKRILDNTNDDDEIEEELKNLFNALLFIYSFETII